MSAGNYAMKAVTAARIMKKVDPSIQFIGSLNYKEMEKKDVLSTGLQKEIDFVSAHFYRVNNRKNEKRYLAVGMGLDDYINGARKTLKRLSSSYQNQLFLCFDEWGARLEPEWHKRTPDGNLHSGEFAPPLGEWPIFLVDSIVDAQFFNAFIRNADLVQIANYSTLVNWFAPIRTNENGVLKQSFFYIFELYRKYGQGISLKPQIVSQKYFDKKVEIPYLDASVCYQKESNTLRLFIVNRDMKNKRFVKIILKDHIIKHCTRAVSIGCQEPYSKNSFENSREILPENLETKNIAAGKIELKPLSLTFIEFKIRSN
jgi:alpha-N-arabinofuranosidase